jgi:hypothetical protein
MINKRLLLCLFVLLSICTLVSLSTFSYAKNNLQNDDYNFMNLKEIKTNASGFLNWGKGWWYYNARSYNSINEMDFSKDFWMPIAPWEYEVCSRGLSTQLVYENGAGVGSTWSGIYGDAATVAAYRRMPERNSNIDNMLLYEISWYFHPADKGKYYNLKLVNSITGASKEIQPKTGASKRTGGSGYKAFYSADVYDRVILTDESTPKEFLFYVIPANDSNR